MDNESEFIQVDPETIRQYTVPPIRGHIVFPHNNQCDICGEPLAQRFAIFLSPDRGKIQILCSSCVKKSVETLNGD